MVLQIVLQFFCKFFATGTQNPLKFCNFFANFSQIFRNFFANFSQIFREFFASGLPSECAGESRAQGLGAWEGLGPRCGGGPGLGFGFQRPGEWSRVVAFGGL